MKTIVALAVAVGVLTSAGCLWPAEERHDRASSERSERDHDHDYDHDHDHHRDYDRDRDHDHDDDHHDHDDEGR